MITLFSEVFFPPYCAVSPIFFSAKNGKKNLSAAKIPPFPIIFLHCVEGLTHSSAKDNLFPSVLFFHLTKLVKSGGKL